jgi:hypothetical protein
LKKLPFPHNTEVLDHDTIFVISNYAWNQTFTVRTFQDAAIQFGWQKDFSAQSYEIQVSFDIAFNALLVTSTSTVNFASASLSNGSYYWRYRIKDKNDNWGSWSSTISFAVNFPSTI